MFYAFLCFAAALGYALFFYYRSKYAVIHKNVSCLELMKEILNVENSLETDTLEKINQVLKEYFKADVSTIVSIENGIIIKANTSTVDGIEYIEKYPEFREAVETKEIRMVKVRQNDLYESAAKRRAQALLFVPLIGKGKVKNVWMLEYRNTKREINFTHLCLIAECLVMPLNNSDLTNYIKGMAFYDSLTDVRNRNGMYQYLNKAIAKARIEGKTFIFSIFDIDHFKNFNETYGHKTGDYILKEIARFVQERLNAQDLIARWGGEEFVVCIPDIARREGVKLIDRIREELSHHVFIHHGQELRVTCSFGITQYMEKDTVDTFFKRADQALYAAKNGGRNRVEFGDGQNQDNFERR